MGDEQSLGEMNNLLGRKEEMAGVGESKEKFWKIQKI